MILGYEQPVDIPVMSIYDKDMMKMYLGALREDYKDSVNAYDKFIDKYGDFISPIEGATEAYYNAGVGGAMDKIRRFEEATGIPAIRSVEGRRVISDAIRGANIPLMNTIKASAENRKAYDQAVLKAKMAGKYDPELELKAIQMDMQQKGIQYDPSKPWDNSVLWDRTAPEIYTSFDDTWKPLMKAIPKKSKRTIDPKTGIAYDQEGVFEEQVDPVINMNYDKWVSTPSGALFLDKVREAVAAENPTATPELVNKIAEENTKEAIRQFGLSTANPDMDKGSAQINEQNWKSGENAKDRANALTIAGMRAGGKDRGGSGKNGDDSTLFADARNNGTSFVGYVPSDADYHKIVPVVNGIKYTNSTSTNTPMYRMTPHEANQCIYPSYQVYSKNAPAPIRFDKQINTLVFIPTGQMHARKTAKGDFRYFISGYVMRTTGNVDAKGKPEFVAVLEGNVYLMEVKQGESNYGQKPNRHNK